MRIEVRKVKILTLEDRKKIEKMLGDNASPMEIAVELGVSQATVYYELRRGAVRDEDGRVVLGEDFRRKYSAEQGEAVFRENRRNQGRRPAKV